MNLRDRDNSQLSSLVPDAVADAVNEGIVMLRRDGSISYCNARFAETVQLPRERVLDSRFQRFLNPVYHSLFDSILARGEPAKHEVALIVPDGRRIPVQLSIRALAEYDLLAVVVTDITEIKQTHEALANVLNNTPNLIVTAWDSKGIYTMAAGRGLAGIGLKPQDFLGTSILVSKTNHPQAVERRRRVMAGEHLRSDDEVQGLVLDQSYAPITDERGTVIGGVAVGIDVTESVHARRQLQQRAFRDEALARFSGRALQGLPLDALAAEATELVREVLAIEMAGIAELCADGRHIVMPVLAGVPDQPEQHRELPLEDYPHIAQTLHSLRPTIVDDYTEDNVYGKTRLALSHGIRASLIAPIVIKNRPYGVLGALSARKRQFTEQDIYFVQAIAHTLALAIERRQAEDELRRSEQYYRSLVANVSDIVSVIKPDGTLLFCNQSLERILGYDAGELIGRNVFDNHHPAYRERVREVYRQVLDHPYQTAAVETRLRHRDGSWRDFEIFVHAVTDLAGEPVIVAATRDVTERRLAERARELARSNADLEQFAYVASHDMKQPLHVIGGFAGLLKQRLDASGPAQLADYAGYIVGGVKKLNELIDMLLDYATLAPSSTTFQAVDCNTVVAAVVKDLDSFVREANAQIVYASLPTVATDRKLLTQVFQNLISNALKFRASTPPLIEISALRQGPEWRFAVRDNGIGISPSDFERVFKMLERLHSERQYPGKGIGLAICRKALERLGGRIWLESQPGQGSTFYFTLPAEGG